VSPSIETDLVLHGPGPVQEQIARQLCRLIAAGILRPGDELPSVRAVAVGLAVNPQAVEQAYARLESEGWVSRAEGSGVLVTAPFLAAPGPKPAEGLERLCRAFLDEAAGQGYSHAEVCQALNYYLTKGMSS
jgi:GntR family transcriptional regulator